MAVHALGRIAGEVEVPTVGDVKAREVQALLRVARGIGTARAVDADSVGRYATSVDQVAEQAAGGLAVDGKAIVLAGSFRA
jgi:hypothetical protein